MISGRLQVMFSLSWSARATRKPSHDSWPYFHMHVVSFQKSPLQICRVSRRIWCLLSSPVSRPCWNRKCEGTRGDKHWCCTTPNVRTATPLGILSGDVPCSKVQCRHSRTAIGWRSMELVSKRFDTPTYLFFSPTCFGQLCAHHQEESLYSCDIGLCHSVWVASGRLFGVSLQPTDQTPPIHSDKYQCRIDKVFSPDYGHIVARNM